MNQRSATPQRPATERTFTVRLSPTRRGARLARLLAVAHLGLWGLPSESAAHIVAELAANATVHGRVPGRDFQLRLTVHADQRLRIEVTDTRGDRLPVAAVPGVRDRTHRVAGAHDPVGHDPVGRDAAAHDV
ncbi:ATP-binding protein [Streptomyces sp. NPDC059818]|uniref:ATP-binding protein n=1 Tax=Streptomyces sp. NPDC059818 TaxID=3346962 RepID=UPI003651110A